MATKPAFVTAFLFLTLIGDWACARGTFAQANPLIGSWRSSGQASSNGYSQPAMTYTVLVSFYPNGACENRLDVAGAEGSAGAGTSNSRWEYRMTSPNTYVLRETGAVMYPVGVRC